MLELFAACRSAKAHELVLLVFNYGETSEDGSVWHCFPRFDGRLSSVAANIAEGFGRGTKRVSEVASDCEVELETRTSCF